MRTAIAMMVLLGVEGLTDEDCPASSIVTWKPAESVCMAAIGASHDMQGCLRICEAFNGTGACPSTAGDNAVLAILGGGWLGLTDVLDENQWVCVASGRLGFYEGWPVVAEYLDHAPTENCAVMMDDGHWLEEACSSPVVRQCLCEAPGVTRSGYRGRFGLNEEAATWNVSVSAGNTTYVLNTTLKTYEEAVAGCEMATPSSSADEAAALRALAEGRRMQAWIGARGHTEGWTWEGSEGTEGADAYIVQRLLDSGRSAAAVSRDPSLRAFLDDAGFWHVAAADDGLRLPTLCMPAVEEADDGGVVLPTSRSSSSSSSSKKKRKATTLAIVVGLVLGVALLAVVVFAVARTISGGKKHSGEYAAKASDDVVSPLPAGDEED